MADHRVLDPAPPLGEDEMIAFAELIETLPPEHMDWVTALLLECQRARQAEAAGPGGGDTTQVVLDAAEWLRTLWEVGYMGSEALPAQPRTDFPQINVEDILKSALFTRIRHGKRPLPFPPPTRAGMPWHEVVESDETFAVRVRTAGDGWMNIEDCPDWQVLEADEAGRRYRVQHRGKGPVYGLSLDEQGGGLLRRLPAGIGRRIVCQSRAGIVVYLLEWPRDDGDALQVPLRAAGWERAETEAQRWVALRHPHLYGQVYFERGEA